jgi:hypothetical protein
VTNPPGVYRSEHFVFYYDEHDFSPAEIVDYARNKEGLLEHVLEYLDTEFNETINVFLNTEKHDARTRQNSDIHESRTYITGDKGHEITHAVAHRLWDSDTASRYRCRFLTEGLAEACEFKHRTSEGANALDYFFSYLARFDTIPNFEPGIREQIVHGGFGYSHLEYARAGAFVHYLKLEFGISEVKEYYKKVNYDYSARSEAEFFNIFGESLDVVVGEFYQLLQSR